MFLGARYIILLTPLGSSSEQDHQRVTFPAEVDSVSRSEIDPVFQNAIPNAFNVGEIALLDPNQGNCDLCGSCRSKRLKP